MVQCRLSAYFLAGDAEGVRAGPAGQLGACPTALCCCRCCLQASTQPFAVQELTVQPDGTLKIKAACPYGLFVGSVSEGTALLQPPYPWELPGGGHAHDE